MFQDVPVAFLLLSAVFDVLAEGLLCGDPVSLWNINYAFRGIVVEEGIHTIEMTFRLRIHEAGLRVTLVTAALLFISYLVTSLLIFRKAGQRLLNWRRGTPFPGAQ